MSTYIILSRLTDKGAETLKDKPQRLKEVNKEMEGFGLKAVAQYGVFGEYDFVNIVEAPNDAAMAKAMVNLNSRGTIKTTTMTAIPVDELIKILKSKLTPP